MKHKPHGDLPAPALIHILTRGSVMRSQDLHFQPGEGEAACWCGGLPLEWRRGRGQSLDSPTQPCFLSGTLHGTVLTSLPVVCPVPSSLATLASTLFSQDSPHAPASGLLPAFPLSYDVFIPRYLYHPHCVFLPQGQTLPLQRSKPWAPLCLLLRWQSSSP